MHYALALLGCLWAGAAFSAVIEKQRYGDWEYRIYSDDMSDVISFLAFTKATAGEGPAIFQLRCSKATDQLIWPKYYLPKTHLGSSTKDGFVGYRIDQHEAVYDPWWRFSDHFAPVTEDREKLGRFVKALEEGATLLLSGYDAFNNVNRHRFSLAGAQEVIARLRSECAENPAMRRGPDYFKRQ
tara:strand:- start:6248 stop:6799 length:552 start_codon:yes stop_codon:yes gene_type:complete